MSTESLPFVLHLDTGSVTFPLSPAAAHDFQTSMEVLKERLRAATQPSNGQPKQAQPAVEFRQRGEVFVEVFCNPNIWPSAHAARLLITLKANGVKLSTETDFTRLLEDLAQFLEAC